MTALAPPLADQDLAVALNHGRHNPNCTFHPHPEKGRDWLCSKEEPGQNKLYSERLLDHFQNPRNAGELASPAFVVEVANPACGDILRLSARVEESRIAEVRYKVRGCAASIAAGSSLTELLTGKTRGEAAAIRAKDVEDSVGGLIPESKHAAVLCVDAVKKLLAAWPR